MTDTIGVELVAQDQQFVKTSKAAAAAVQSIATQETKLAAAAKALGVDGSKFSQQFAKLEGKRVAADVKATKQAELSQKKAIADDAKKTRQAETAQKKQAKANADYDKKYQAAAGEELAEATAVGAETLAIGVAALGAVAAYVALAVAIGGAALKAAEAKQNALGFFNVLTAGRGDKLLENVDRLAGSLGLKFNDARQSFIEFRQAGLDNKQSAALLKLTADLNTVDHSGKLAAEAVERTLAFTSNHTQTSIQAEASAKTMALLARQAHVAGNGTEAAAESVNTMVGALNRIDNSKTKVLETIGERIKPSVDKAASAVANMVEQFINSERGRQAIDVVVKGITLLSDAVAYVATNAAAFGAAIEAAANNPTAQTALLGLKIILGATAIALAVLAAGAALMAAPILALGAAVVWGVGKLTELSVSAEHFGKDIITGLLSGLWGGLSSVGKAVGAVATKVKDTFKNALGINSPSTVFEGFGINIGAGTERGVNRAMPTGAELASRMIPRASNDNAERAAYSVSYAAPTGGGQAPGQQGSPPPESGPTFIFQITGGNADEIATEIERRMDQWWARKQLQQGRVA